MPDRRSQIATILEVLHDAFRRRDLDTIGRYFAEDVRLLTPDGAARGRAVKLADEQKVFESFDDAEVEVIELLIDGDAAAEFCLLHATLRGGQVAGRRIALRYAVRYRFEADLIVTQEICFDRAALGAQLAPVE